MKINLVKYDLFKKQNVVSFNSRTVLNTNKSDTISFGNRSHNRKKDIPAPLHSLFKALPKAETHLHLSGSTPIGYVKEILKEEGLPKERIIEETKIANSFVSLEDFLKTYYRVTRPIQSTKHFREASYQICMEAAKENVKYLEIRTGLLNKKETPQEILQSVADGINQAKQKLASKGFNQTAKIIVLAQRTGTTADSLAHAKIATEAIKRPESLVVGFDIAGDEAKVPAYVHAEAIKYAKDHGVKVTLHAGETPKSGDLTAAESIKNCIDLGADRLGHAVHIFDDPAVLKEVVDKQIPVESPPKSNIQTKAVKSYSKHPIKDMLNANVNVSVASDNRTISKTNITNEFEELYKHNVINNWTDIKKLVMNGVNSIFAPENEKKALVAEFEKSLKTIESNKFYQGVINNYLTPENNVYQTQKLKSA